MSSQALSGSGAKEIIARFRETFDAISSCIAGRIVGHQQVVEGIITALFCNGHVLLEGLPGLGKTLLVQTLAEAIGLQYSRIQFTPDLMPADIIGTKVFLGSLEGEKDIRFEKGPIFANALLADEINRTTPKTQSALLQAMQEHQVTVANTTHSLPEPFMVLATQNPIEMEGTYPLPEAQLDRFFFKLEVSLPSLGELVQIATRTTQGTAATINNKTTRETIVEMKKFVPQVCVADYLLEYAGRIVLATHGNSESNSPLARQYVKYGSSPRGMQALILGAKVQALRHGRGHVSAEDIQAVALPALCHRLILNFEAEADGITAANVVRQILETQTV